MTTAMLVRSCAPAALSMHARTHQLNLASGFRSQLHIRARLLALQELLLQQLLLLMLVQLRHECRRRRPVPHACTDVAPCPSSMRGTSSNPTRPLVTHEMSTTARCTFGQIKSPPCQRHGLE